MKDINGFGGKIMNKKVLASALSVCLLAAGCSNADESKKEDVKKEVTQTPIQKGNEEQKEGSENMNENPVLTKKLKAEEGITDAKVFEKNGKALARFVVDKKVSEKEIKKLAEKYAKELEKEYKDQEVNVQAIKAGKVIEEVTAGVKKTNKETVNKTNKGEKTAKELHATVINTVPGVFAIKLSLKDAKLVDATEKSTLILDVDGKASVILKYNAEHKVFLNANIQGDYTQAELLNGTVSVKKQ